MDNRTFDKKGVSEESVNSLHISFPQGFAYSRTGYPSFLIRDFIHDLDREVISPPQFSQHCNIPAAAIPEPEIFAYYKMTDLHLFHQNLSDKIFRFHRNNHRYERTLDKNIDPHVSYNFSALFDREQRIVIHHKGENNRFRRPPKTLM